MRTIAPKFHGLLRKVYIIPDYEYLDDIYDKVQRLMKSVIFAIFILRKDIGVGGCAGLYISAENLYYSQAQS